MTRILISIILAVLLLSTSAFAGQKIVLTSGEWPPYISQEFKHGGLGTKIVTEALGLAGIEVEYVYMPWKRGLESVKEGQYIGAMGWSRTEEREQYLLYSEPIFAPETVFFHRKDTKFDWTTLDDIGTMTVGGTLGYSYNDFLRPIIRKKGGKLDIAPTDQMSMLKLVDGRIDIFPCARAVGYYLLRAKLLPGLADTITSHPKPLMQKSVHLVISKNAENAQEIIDRFNEGLLQMRRDGRFAQYEMESLRGDYLP